MVDEPGLSPNSARYWLPRIKAVAGNGLLVPNTIVVPYNHVETVVAIEDRTEWPGWEPLIDAVWAAVQELGTAFIRTDLASAKHDGPSSYLARSRGEVEHCLSFTIQDSELKFWPFGPFPTAILVREFLWLAAPFKAFGGHPIAREWRYFASSDGLLQCRHFYWPEHAIEHGADTEGWRKLLADMAAEPPPGELDEIAMRAAEACPAAPAWSIDFAQDIDGVWWTIDMAVAADSWHPEHDDTDTPHMEEP